MSLPATTVRYLPDQNRYEAILDGVSLGTFPREIDATMAGHRVRLQDLDDTPQPIAVLGADLHLAVQITDLRPMPAPIPQQYSTTPLEALTATLILLNRNWLRATLAGRHPDAQQIAAHEQCVRAQIHARCRPTNKPFIPRKRDKGSYTGEATNWRPEPHPQKDDSHDFRRCQHDRPPCPSHAGQPHSPTRRHHS